MENPKNLQVGAVFSDSKRFVVPIYQRAYEWVADKQVARLFDHIEAKARARLDGQAQSFAHYMGALLLIPRGSFVFGTIPVFDVVDGQQRLTTFQILLAALHDVARARGFEGITNQLRPLLHNLDEASMQDKKVERYKLEPTRFDRPLFRHLFDLDGDALQKEYAGHFYKNGNIKEGAPKPLTAFWYLREEAKAFIDEPESSNPELRLRALLQALLEDLRLIVITLDKDDDAQVIFETLNSGGQPLAAMDLVRNDVFHRARKQEVDPEELMERRWSRFETEFWKANETQGRLTKPRIDFFLGHTLAAETGKEMQLTELYAAYKDFVSKRKFPSVNAELDTLLRYAPTYEGLVLRTGGGALAGLARALSVFDVRTAYPLVFVVAASEADDDTKAAIYRLIESYIVRRALCVTSAAKAYNNTFARVAGQVKAGGSTLASVSAAFASLDGPSVRFPLNTELSAAIRERAQYGSMPQPRLKFIIAELEAAARDKFDETEGLRDDLQIEHVLPDSWMEHWPLPDGAKAPADLSTGLDEARRALVQARQSLKHTLGNLTLLTPPANKEVLNYAFVPSKRDRLRSSLLKLNQEIASNESWDEVRILTRAERLAKLATRIWPAPSEG